MNLSSMNQPQQQSSGSSSSVIIRLQNLAWEARSHDIRQFFGGLIIPDGGVHIIGGPDGDAFIAFQSDEDARKGMLRNGHLLCGNQVRLMLSSKNEMYNIIAQAKMSNPYNSSTVPITSSSTISTSQQQPQQSSQQSQQPSQQSQLHQPQQQQTAQMHSQHHQSQNQHHQLMSQQHHQQRQHSEQTAPTKPMAGWFQQENTIPDRSCLDSGLNKSMTIPPTKTNSASEDSTQGESRKLTVVEVQEKLSSMLNSARASGSLQAPSGTTKVDSPGGNDNERVALNFAQQLFSLLEMSTPSGGGTSPQQPQAVTPEIQQTASERSIASPDRDSQENQRQQQQLYTIPGLGNPIDISLQSQQNTQQAAYNSGGSRNGHNATKLDQHMQHPQLRNIPPSAVSTSMATSFPTLSAVHIPPFNMNNHVIPPPGHSFDMNILGGPPRMIRPPQSSEYTHQFPPNPSYFADHPGNPLSFNQIPPTLSSIPHGEVHGISPFPVGPPFHINNPSICSTDTDDKRMHNFEDTTSDPYHPPINDDPVQCSIPTLRLSSCSVTDIMEPYLKLSNLSDVQTYKIVRQLLYPNVKIRLRDLKIVNNQNGQRTGCALLSFMSVDDARAALQIAVERSQANVGVHVCTEYDFVCAVDSYMSTATRKRNNDGFHAMRIIGFPAKWDKRDIRKFFDGVMFHSRDKVQILETDFRNSLHNIAIVLLASQIDMERAMFYDGEETGHGRLSVSAVTKEQVELETSSARYRQQQNRERSGSQSNSRGGGSSSNNGASYESRSRRLDDDRQYSVGTDRIGAVSPQDQTKRFRGEDDQIIAGYCNGAVENSTVRLSGFPVLYTENDMRNLLIRAQLISNGSSDSSGAPTPEVICIRDKVSNRLTGDVIVKFPDANICRRALSKARNVLAGKSIEAEVVGALGRQTKRSRIDMTLSEQEEILRQHSSSGFENRKDNRFSNSERPTNHERPDYDDRRRPNDSGSDQRYNASRSSKTSIEGKSRSRREFDKREISNRFNIPSGETTDRDVAFNYNRMDTNLTPEASVNTNFVNDAPPPLSEHMKNSNILTQNFSAVSQASNILAMPKRPLLPDPVLLASSDATNQANNHMVPIPPPPVLPSTSQTSIQPNYTNPQTTLQHVNSMRGSTMMPRAPLNLPPMPSELTHLKGQILLLDNVPYRATKEDICGWLSQFKPIESSLKIRHDDSGRPTGHAIVALQTRQDAELACSVLCGTQLLGRIIQAMLM